MIMQFHDMIVAGLEEVDENVKPYPSPVVGINRDKCYVLLKYCTHQDFGFDVGMWQAWFMYEDNVKIFYEQLEKIPKQELASLYNFDEGDK